MKILARNCKIDTGDWRVVVGGANVEEKEYVVDMIEFTRLNCKIETFAEFVEFMSIPGNRSSSVELVVTDDNELTDDTKWIIEETQ